MSYFASSNASPDAQYSLSESPSETFDTPRSQIINLEPSPEFYRETQTPNPKESDPSIPEISTEKFESPRLIDRIKVSTKSAKQTLELAGQLETCIQKFDYSAFDSCLIPDKDSASPIKQHTKASPSSPLDSDDRDLSLSMHEKLSEEEFAKMQEIETLFVEHWRKLIALKIKFETAIQIVEDDCKFLSESPQQKVSRLQANYHKQYRILEEQIENDKKVWKVELQMKEIDRNAEINMLEIELSSLKRRVETLQKVAQEQMITKPLPAIEPPQFDFSISVCLMAGIIGAALNIGLKLLFSS